MLQARVRGEVGWYRPDRDIIDALPKLARKAIVCVSARWAEDKEKMDLIGEMARHVAMIINKSKDKEFTQTQLERELNAFAVTSEKAALYSEYKAVLFELLFLSFRQWALEMIPENKDGTVDYAKLKEQNETKSNSVE